MSIEVGEVTMRQEISLFQVANESSSLNIVNHELKIVQVFDGCFQLVQVYFIQLHFTQCHRILILFEFKLVH